MFTQEIPYDLIGVNIAGQNRESLADISSIEFDNSIPKEERMDYVLKYLKNPFCFRHGQMGIKIEFDDNGPPLSEAFIRLLIRKKSGL